MLWIRTWLPDESRPHQNTYKHRTKSEDLTSETLAPGGSTDHRTTTSIDPFAGAGGLSLGFHLLNSDTCRHAVEHELAAAKTFERNFGCEVFAAISSPQYPSDLHYRWLAVDSAFGVTGQHQPGMAQMARKHFLDAVRTVRPKAFVIENVQSFSAQPSSQSFHLLETDSNFHVHAAYGVLNAADYGVHRPDFEAFSSQSATTAASFSLYLFGPESPDELPYRTVRDAIADLPAGTTGLDPYFDDAGEQHLHFGRRPTQKSLERYRSIPPGGNRFDLMKNRPDITPACWANKPTGTTDVMGRLWWDRPSATIRTEFFKPEKGRYLHPVEDRVISHREGARLQSFPDWYLFEGTKIEIARQIGNAVPPLLGAAIARYVYEHAFASD